MHIEQIIYQVFYYATYFELNADIGYFSLTLRYPKTTQSQKNKVVTLLCASILHKEVMAAISRSWPRLFVRYPSDSIAYMFVLPAMLLHLVIVVFNVHCRALLARYMVFALFNIRGLASEWSSRDRYRNRMDGWACSIFILI